MEGALVLSGQSLGRRPSTSPRGAPKVAWTLLSPSLNKRPAGKGEPVQGRRSGKEQRVRHKARSAQAIRAQGDHKYSTRPRASHPPRGDPSLLPPWAPVRAGSTPGTVVVSPLPPHQPSGPSSGLLARPVLFKAARARKTPRAAEQGCRPRRRAALMQLPDNDGVPWAPGPVLSAGAQWTSSCLGSQEGR